MVVLSASICTRQGKALVSRQFVEMNRLRVEGLLAAFPKLIGQPAPSQHGGGGIGGGGMMMGGYGGGMGGGAYGSIAPKQHTYVETDSVRYVYQPLENQIYLLLITTKTSNIVEDLGTLRLLGKVVSDITGLLQEATINDHAFELIFAFDEVLSAGGYKEEVNLSVIRTNLEMDSQEEKIHLALKQSKEEQAMEEMRRQAKTIKERKLTHLRQNLVQGGDLNSALSGGGRSLGGMEGFGSGGPNQGGGGGGFFDQFDPNNQNNNNNNNDNQWNNDPYGQQQQVEQPQPPKVIAKGMKIGMGGSAGKKDSWMAQMAAEDNLLPLGSKSGGKGGAMGGAGAFGLGTAVEKPKAVPSTPLTVALEEKITVVMNREGGVESCEVKGTLTLTANTDAGTMAMVPIHNKQLLPTTFNYATHPKVDKKTYEKDGNLILKGGKGFPLNRPVGILRWSYNGDDAAPLSINCWPEDEGNGSITVNIEMELTNSNVQLQDVNILLPLGTTDPPVIESIDGVYKHDAHAGMMCWHFDQVDANNNSTGSLEFRIGGGDTSVFFPIQVGFRSETLLCPIDIQSITNVSNGTVIPNQLSKNFSPESYQIV